MIHFFASPSPASAGHFTLSPFGVRRLRHSNIDGSPCWPHWRDNPMPDPWNPAENVLPGNQMKFILLQRQHIDDIAFLAKRKAKKWYIICRKSTWNGWNSTKTVFQEPSDFWNIWPFFWKARFAPYLKVPLKLHLKAKHVFTHLKVNGGCLSSIASFWHLIQLSEVVQQKYERQIASSQPLMARFFMTNPHWTRPKSTGYSVGWPDFYQNSSPTDHTSSLPLKQNHFVHVKHPVSFFWNIQWVSSLSSADFSKFKQFWWWLTSIYNSQLV